MKEILEVFFSPCCLSCMIAGQVIDQQNITAIGQLGHWDFCLTAANTESNGTVVLIHLIYLYITHRMALPLQDNPCSQNHGLVTQ